MKVQNGAFRCTKIYESIKKWMKVCHVMNVKRDGSCAKVENRVKTFKMLIKT